MLSRIAFLAVVALMVTLAHPAAAQDRGAAALAARAHPMPLHTDVNLITAIDVSGSITRHDERLQYSGLARGVVDAAFLARIAEGHEQRIGFMAFTWSSGGEVEVIVPWTVIETRRDGLAVAAQFDAAPRIDRSGYGMYRPSRLDRPRGGKTDIAQALEAALRHSLAAPFAAPRSVVNILSNGVDNDGQDPRLLRDQAVRLGITVNGIVFGPHRDLPDYFRRNIIGGPGAFLMTVEKPEDLPRALEKKFWQDLVAGLTAAPAG